MTLPMVCPAQTECNEKGSRADNGGFVSAKMTARKQSFFTLLFTQNTHDTNGVRARKRKAKAAFGLMTCRSDSHTALVGVQFPTKAKRVSFTLSIPKWVTPSKVCHLHAKDRSSGVRCACSPTPSPLEIKIWSVR